MNTAKIKVHLAEKDISIIHCPNRIDGRLMRIPHLTTLGEPHPYHTFITRNKTNYEFHQCDNDDAYIMTWDEYLKVKVAVMHTYAPRRMLGGA
tara:strand:- start:2 stop:280 length:279 start_codon:yes stop_codon:yes gene_type:complete